jgi:hypothetical protein
MATALDMPAAERAARLAGFRERVKRWTAAHWLSAQLADLGIGAPVPRPAYSSALRSTASSAGRQG